MKKVWILLGALFLSPLVVQGQTPAALPGNVGEPFFLRSTDNIPASTLAPPPIPDLDTEGRAIKSNESIDAPPLETMAHFSDPDLIEILQNEKKKEKQIGQVYWDAGGDPAYFCHLMDAEGNHWYGWDDGQAFHWVLRTGKRFWWRDSFANHWLYFAGNHWWRGDIQTTGQLQVLINGEYYLCQRDGTIVKDMGQDGNGGIISASGRYQGDFHNGGHGGRGGGPGGGHSANGSNGASAAGGSGSAGSGAGTSGQ